MTLGEGLRLSPLFMLSGLLGNLENIRDFRPLQRRHRREVFEGELLHAVVLGSRLLVLLDDLLFDRLCELVNVVVGGQFCHDFDSRG